MMRLRSNLALAAALLALGAGAANAQVGIAEENTNIGTSSAEFLTIGAGARGMALGGSFAAIVNDVESMYYNPAGLPLMETGLQGMLSVQPYFADTNYYWMGLAFPFSDGQYGLGVQLGSFTFGDQPIYTEDDPDGLSGRTYNVSETFVGLSFAHAFIDRFTAGVTAKVVLDNLADASATAFAIDIGTNYHATLGGRPISLAVVIQNLGGSLQHSGSGLDFTAFPAGDPIANVDESPARFRAQGFPLPTTFRAGLAYDVVSNLDNRVTLLGEFNETNSTKPGWSFAGEYEWDNPNNAIAAALRGSYSYQADNYFSSEEQAEFAGVADADDRGLDGLALGGGLKYRLSNYEARLDYTFRHYGTLGSRDVFTFGFAVGSP